MKNVRDEVLDLLKEVMPERIGFAWWKENVWAWSGKSLPEIPFKCVLNLAKHKNEWEEIHSLLHEVLHDLPCFDPDINEEPYFDEQRERRIDAMAIELLSTELLIFEQVWKKLRKAKSLILCDYYIEYKP